MCDLIQLANHGASVIRSFAVFDRICVSLRGQEHLARCFVVAQRQTHRAQIDETHIVNSALPWAMRVTNAQQVCLRVPQYPGKIRSPPYSARCLARRLGRVKHGPREIWFHRAR